MQSIICAAIDPVATGRNILKLRMERNLSVRDIQRYFHFDEPRAIYKWQTGKSLPNLDNLYALSVLFKVPMDRIIVGNRDQIISTGPQEKSCGSVFVLLTMRQPAKRLAGNPFLISTLSIIWASGIVWEGIVGLLQKRFHGAKRSADAHSASACDSALSSCAIAGMFRFFTAPRQMRQSIRYCFGM